ncbi:MAG TPA: sugar ABC transporter substrate-binding protein [Firmicutes bacterium]|jgi:ribose transport system substrate-binding protein|nr:sugar ABC transporter substrate-binding protein [Bacillota bacterium]
MKKRSLFSLLGVAIMAICLVGNGIAAPKKVLKVGMTVQSVSNPIWAGICSETQKAVKADGGEMTYMACDSNITTQIQQVENFISSKVNVIVCHPADPKGIENVLMQARKAGIKVISWDDKLENADLAYVINNYDLGKMIGEEAAKWINKKLGGKAEVAVLDWPQLPILLERANGIVDALKKNAPKAKIVAQQPAIDAAGGQTKMESIFQAHPNVKVVACIGGGGAIGANEAAKAANKISPDFGIFAADATEQELQAIKNHEGNRMSVMITGGPVTMAKEIYGLIKKVASGKKVDKVFYRKIFPVTIENVGNVPN